MLCYAMFDFMQREQRRVNMEHGRAKKCVGMSILGNEKGAFGYGKGAFGAWKGYTSNFEQGLGAMHGAAKIENDEFSCVFILF